MHLLFVAVAALAAGGWAAADLGVNVYFGQNGAERLASYCESDGFDYVTLAFLSAAPQADPATEYPATNFGAHCAAGVYYTANQTASRLLSDCTVLRQDIRYCQRQRGKKVLLSVGGVWGPDPAHDYRVTTAADGEYFADFLWKAFGPVDPAWAGPRPFDLDVGADGGADDTHTVLDGFDFDIEVRLADQAGYVALLQRLRRHADEFAGEHGKTIMLTAAPQCPLSDEWFQMKDMITQAAFDKLWIQFYNNEECQMGGGGDFNYDAWEAFIAGTASKDALLYVGLPAQPEVNGYVPPVEANRMVDELRKRPSFGGVMVWDVALARESAVDGVAFYEAVHQHMVGLAVPTVSAESSVSAEWAVSTSATSASSAPTLTASVPAMFSDTIAVSAVSTAAVSTAAVSTAAVSTAALSTASPSTDALSTTTMFMTTVTLKETTIMTTMTMTATTTVAPSKTASSVPYASPWTSLASSRNVTTVALMTFCSGSRVAAQTESSGTLRSTATSVPVTAGAGDQRAAALVWALALALAAGAGMEAL